MLYMLCVKSLSFTDIIVSKCQTLRGYIDILSIQLKFRVEKMLEYLAVGKSTLIQITTRRPHYPKLSPINR